MTIEDPSCAETEEALTTTRRELEAARALTTEVLLERHDALTRAEAAEATIAAVFEVGWRAIVERDAWADRCDDVRRERDEARRERDAAIEERDAAHRTSDAWARTAGDDDERAERAEAERDAAIEARLDGLRRIGAATGRAFVPPERITDLDVVEDAVRHERAAREKAEAALATAIERHAATTRWLARADSEHDATKVKLATAERARAEAEAGHGAVAAFAVHGYFCAIEVAERRGLTGYQPVACDCGLDAALASTAGAAALRELEAGRRAVAALTTIAQWDCLNPPRADLLADLKWLRGVVDEALAPKESR